MRVKLMSYDSREVVGWCDLNDDAYNNLISLMLAGTKIKVHGSLMGTSTSTRLMSLSFVPEPDQPKVCWVCHDRVVAYDVDRDGHVVCGECWDERMR